MTPDFTHSSVVTAGSVEQDCTLIWVATRASRGGRDLSGLIYRPAHGLGDVDAFLQCDGRGGDHGVAVVGRADDDGVDALFLFEHQAVIAIGLGRGIGLENRRGESVVHIGDGHDVLALAPLDVVLSHAADAHGGDVKLVAGGGVSGPQHVPGNDGEGGRGCGQEPAAREGAFLVEHEDSFP